MLYLHCEEARPKVLIEKLLLIISSILPIFKRRNEGTISLRCKKLLSFLEFGNF